MRITAAVVFKKNAPFSIEQIDLSDPRDDELLVEIAASGMCATDLHGRDAYYPTKFPKVFGHEGAGVVRAVGRRVREFKAGDHVVMAYPWCGECANCRSHRQTYCTDANTLKHGGTRADGSTVHSLNGKPVYGAFFQQSSFGTYAIANQRYAVKIRNDVPLQHLCALACGGQTGAGAVLNTLKPKPDEGIAVFGVGAVGLSALMAAKIVGCDPIVAVDVHAKRLKLAREFGATHVFNHDGKREIVSAITKAVGPLRYSIETTANPSVFREAAEVLMPAGTCVLLGSARAGTDVKFDMQHLQNGRNLRGVIQGDSVPKVFLPQLADHMVAGRFPIERMIKFYPLAKINWAAEDSAKGKTIKPVLRMAN